MSKKAQEERKSLIEESCPISCNKFELPLLNSMPLKQDRGCTDTGNLAQFELHLLKMYCQKLQLLHQIVNRTSIINCSKSKNSFSLIPETKTSLN